MEIVDWIDPGTPSHRCDSFPNKARSLCSKDERVVSDENDGAREEPDDTHLVIMTSPEPGFPSRQRKKRWWREGKAG